MAASVIKLHRLLEGNPMKAFIIAGALLVSGAAFGQQQPPMTTQTILQNTVGVLVGQNADITVQLEQANRRAAQLADELAKANARIKELEAKLDAKK